MCDRERVKTAPGTGLVIAASLGLPGLLTAILLLVDGAPFLLALLAYLGIPPVALGLFALATRPRPGHVAKRRLGSAHG